MAFFLTTAAALSAATGARAAFDLTKDNNMVAYWGQDSVCANGGTTDCQQWIGAYCDDDTYDLIIMSSLTAANATGGYPEINLANSCADTTNGTFPGTDLANCTALEAGIEKCQAAGIPVMLSLGGAGGSISFTDNSSSQAFGDVLWNVFMGGQDQFRPFGNAILDGIDLDLEGGDPDLFSPMVAQLLTHFNGANKTYYLSAAPQCPFPDSYLGTVLNDEPFDFVNIQFYNNMCGVTEYNTSAWDYSSWADWATATSPNPDVKLMIGAPAASSAANPGQYVDAATLGGIWQATAANSSTTLGGVMLWDISQAEANGDYAQAVDGYMDGTANSPFRPKSLSNLTDGVNHQDAERVVKRMVRWH